MTDGEGFTDDKGVSRRVGVVETSFTCFATTIKRIMGKILSQYFHLLLLLNSLFIVHCRTIPSEFEHSFPWLPCLTRS